LNLGRAVTRPRTRPFREETALDVLLFGREREVRLMALRHLASAAASVRRLVAHRQMAEAFGQPRGET